MDTDFVTWLTGEMDRRDWNNTDLAKRAGVVPSTVSMIISGHKKPGLEFCVGVARAFGVSPEYVLRLAGHLPPRLDPSGLPPETSELVRELNELLLRQPEPEQRRIMTAVLMLLRGADVTVTPLDEP